MLRPSNVVELADGFVQAPVPGIANGALDGAHERVDVGRIVQQAGARVEEVLRWRRRGHQRADEDVLREQVSVRDAAADAAVQQTSRRISSTVWHQRACPSFSRTPGLKRWRTRRVNVDAISDTERRLLPNGAGAIGAWTSGARAPRNRPRGERTGMVGVFVG